MQQQQQMQLQQQPIESIFDESYSQVKQMWLPFSDEEYDQLNESELIFQGRLFQKNSKSKKWQFFHFELYCDKLVRVGDTEETQYNTLDFRGNNMNNSTSQEQQEDCIIKNGDDQDINENSCGKQYNKSNSKNQQQDSTGFDLSNIDVIQKNNFKDQEKFFMQLNCCFLKKIRYSDNVASNYKFGIRLQRDDVKCELFTENAQSFNKWYEEIKRYCLLSKFNKKYKILTKMKGFHNQASLYYKGFRFYDSIQYCIRVIDKFTLSDPGRQSLIKEVGILRRIDHPILLKLVEVYEDEVNVFIVMEIFHGKNLKQKMNEFICLDEKTVSDIMWKLLHGLSHIHSKNMVHRDIKLENIFFRNPNNLSDICLGGFQNSEVLRIKSKSPQKIVGTVGYMAPELFVDKPVYGQKIDVFSLGCVFHALVFGVLPFEEQDQQQIEKLNQQCKINYDKQPPFFKLSQSAKDLMQKMLDKNPQVRGSAAQLLNHTWFVNMRNKNYHEKTKHQNMMGFSSLSTIKEHNSEFDNTFFQSSKLCNTISISHNENLQFKFGSQMSTQQIKEDHEDNEDDDQVDMREDSTLYTMNNNQEFYEENLYQKMMFLNNQTSYRALNSKSCYKNKI